MKKNYTIQSLKKMIKKAYEKKYAICHFNITNLETTKCVLEAAQESKSPIILGASSGAIKYMGGYNTVVKLIQGLMIDLKITIPVSLHLDHGKTFEIVKDAIDAGFSSVMFDGSHLSFSENYKITKKIIEYIGKRDISLEVELGEIGGEEDGVIGSGELANIEECLGMWKLNNVTIIAAGINNIHGKYPENWTGLNFDILKELQAYKIPCVLHGGSGIPIEQIKKAISFGIVKINIDTEAKLSFYKGTKRYFNEKKDLLKKGFDLRKWLNAGVFELKNKIIEIFKNFGSYNQS